MAGTPASSVPSSGGATIISYVEFTANVAVTGVNFAGANAVVTAAAIAYAGVAIVIEFYAPIVEAGATAGAAVTVCLCDGATGLLNLGAVQTAAALVTDVPFYARRYITPTAASHTYNVKAYRNVANGIVAAGAGGSDTLAPGFLRITTA